VERKLEARWSPQQISGWLAEQYPNDSEMQVSHETIYQSLFVQSRGALRRELHACLRTGRAMRRAKAYTKGNVGQGQLRDLVMISERPAEVADRAVPGHWEGDLIFGKKMTSIGTLVERHTNGLLRQYLPKSTDLSQCTQRELDTIARSLNTRPRQTLGWMTPSQAFANAVAMTA